MSKAGIPLPVQQNLDLIGPESSDSDKKWQQAFYTRIIQSTVKLNIENFDYKNLKGLECANALKTFVNNGPHAAQELMLTDMMKNFNQVSHQSLPGSITSRFSTAFTKKVAKEAYQRLIMLEVVYYVEALLKQEKEKTELSKEWKEIGQWIHDKKSALTPPFSLVLLMDRVRLKLFGTFFEGMYDWTKHTVPFLALHFFTYLVNSPRRAIKIKQSVQSHLFHFAMVPLQAMLYPFALFLGGMSQIARLAMRITSLPLELAHMLLGNRFEKKLRLIEIGKNIGVSLFIFLYPFSHVLTASSIIAATSFVTVVGGGIGLFLVDKMLNAFKVKLPLLDNKSLLMDWREMAIISLSALFPSFTADRINHLIAEGEKIIKENGKLYDKKKQLIADKNFTPENLKERQQLYKAAEDCFDRGVRLIEQSIGIDLIDLSLFKSMLLEPVKTELQLTQSENTTEGYDKNKLIAVIMKLKANSKQTQEKYGPEVADQLSKMNPHTYLADFKTKAALPLFLQQLAVAPMVESNNDNKKNLNWCGTT